MMPPLFATIVQAAAEVERVLNTSFPIDPSILILVGALVLVTLGIFIWAAFYRKTKRHSHHHGHHRHRHDKPQPTPGPAPKVRTETGDSGQGMFSRRRRRRRRKERPRNPTLAETGGLPPLRKNPSEPPPSSA